VEPAGREQASGYQKEHDSACPTQHMIPKSQMRTVFSPLNLLSPCASAMHLGSDTSSTTCRWLHWNPTSG